MASSKDKHQAEPTPKAPPLTYIGPNIPGLASYGQVFLSLPADLEEHLNKCPDMRALLISPSVLMSARNSASTRLCFRRAEAYLAKST